MNQPRVCSNIEPDIVASATGDSDPVTDERVQRHIHRCPPCAGEYQRYRAIERVVGAIRRVPIPMAAAGRARKRLEVSLQGLRHRPIAYRIFPSPLGQILIGQSEQGVSLVEYLGSRGDVRHSRLAHMRGVEAVEDGAEVEARYRELMEYLEGKRTRLEWPLDLRLVRSDFHRHVLSATSEIPYGAVTSYAGLACQVGKPTADRHPLPPRHRDVRRAHRLRRRQARAQATAPQHRGRSHAENDHPAKFHVRLLPGRDVLLPAVVLLDSDVRASASLDLLRNTGPGRS